ncbi:predicted protein [Arabidopsis lyrata subsp. lyrata]|uniref:Predicted protein n=1 Tax=Arabidopsis lyrata subsp. lyrata TaxID=81972 RepID=D7KMV1_ARALL|nr:predicted protein [Arabidopsis lyrata subsp. lyrata]
MGDIPIGIDEIRTSVFYSVGSVRMSETEDNNEAFLGEEVDGTTESSARRRRPTTERSSSDVPKPKKAKKKQAHRAEVW